MRGKMFGGASIVVLSLLAVTSAYAELYRINFDARTWRTYTGSPLVLADFMSFWIEVYDSERKNPPDYVDSITITAPNGSTYAVTAKDHWSYLDRGYGVRLTAADLGATAFQAGAYRVTVKSGTVTLNAADALNPLVWLNPPTLTYPVEGQSNVPERPVIRWNAVSGAARYGISLWCTSTNEPVYNYYYGTEPVYTNLNRFTIPKGVLKPNKSYRIQIQARSNLQDTDARSHGMAVNFTTGSW